MASTLLNDLTGAAGRCRYSSQTRMKATRVRLERVTGGEGGR